MTLRVAGFTWRSSAVGATQLGPVDLAVERGERVLLLGASGSGKSTLLRALAGLLGTARSGVPSGQVTLDGLDPEQSPVAGRAALLGFGFQEGRDQVLTGTVRDEVALGPRWAGQTDASSRAQAALDAVGSRVHVERDPAELSGGERQRVLVAAHLAARPGWLIFDELLTGLDGPGREAVVRAVSAIPRDVGVVVAEHEWSAWWSWATRLVILEAGRVVYDAARPAEPPQALLTRLGLAPLAPPPKVMRELGGTLFRWRGPLIRQGRSLFDGCFELRRGERVVLFGDNGVGKTTWLRTLADLGSGAWLPQDADLALSASTVLQEVGGNTELLAAFDLADRAHALPQGLSRGERQRVAVAATMALSCPFVVLDEPTAGLDHRRKAELGRQLGAYGAPTWLVATHDRVWGAGLADRVLEIRDGVLRELP